MTADKNDQRFADEMKAWMMIQVIGQTSVNFLNVRKLKKEMTEHVMTLCNAITSGENHQKDDAASNPDEGSSRMLSFCDYFIDTCLTSKSYRTAVFGTMSMSDAGAATRIAQDIIEVTQSIPKRFGLEEDARPIQSAMLKSFVGKVENASSILNELNISIP